jgi:uncharacterized membrane protein
MHHSFFPRHRITHHLLTHPRLLISFAVGIAAFFIQPDHWMLATRLLIAWNTGTWLYIIIASVFMLHASEHSIRTQALRGDESRYVVLILATLAAITSLAAIVVQLGSVRDAHGLMKALHIGLASSTILSAWTFIHLMFAQHYAHEYFIERLHPHDTPSEAKGGLRFPGTEKPDFFDFLYFSFVIGVASQTADVEIWCKPIRRICLAHCILSFFFNTTILALTINIGAGLLT